jgi:hypothetical protein
MEKLGPTLDSLLKQTAAVNSIILWLPKKYRRAAFNDYRVPDLPQGVELRYCDTDYGPATKILPAVQSFKGQDVKLIYCDDDEVYDADWAELMIRESDRYPNDCISIVGMNIALIEYEYLKTTWRHKLRSYLTPGRKERHRQQTAELRAGAGLVDICQGFGGVLVKPHFLPPSAFDIPEVLWTVDDVWLAGQMMANGVRVRRVSEFKKSHKSDAAHIERLTSFVHDGHDRIAADMQCVNYFRRKYGIWK